MQPSDAVRRPWIPKILALPIGIIAPLVGLIALVVRCTVRDATIPASTIYYASPLPVIGLLFLVGGGCWWDLRNRRSALLCWGIAIGCLIGILCFGIAYGGPVAATQTPAYRFLFWNTSKGKGGWPRLFRRIRSVDPDIIAIVEACGDGSLSRHPWEAEFPDYELTAINEQMLLACRGKVKSQRVVSLDTMGKLKHCRVEMADGVTLNVLLVDIKSDPFKSRRYAMRALCDYVRSLGAQPCIIAGDFNTPIDSVFFAPLLEMCTHAVEQCARGYAATWPVPLPVLQIDHVLGNRGIAFHACHLESSIGSDHRMIICDVSLADPPQATAINR